MFIRKREFSIIKLKLFRIILEMSEFLSEVTVKSKKSKSISYVLFHNYLSFEI